MSRLLRNYKHLRFSSEEVIAKIRSTHVPVQSYMLHVDLDDFYMTGARDWLVQHNGFLVGNSEKKKLVREVLKFLLSYQFVYSSFMTDRIWRMISGASQGAIHAMVCAVGAFLHAFELAGPGIATKRFQQRHGIFLFIRFIDNMLFFLHDQSYAEPLMQVLHTKLGPYKVKIEEASDFV